MGKPINKVIVEIHDFMNTAKHTMSEKVISITKSLSLESTPGRCEVVVAYHPIFITIGSIIKVWVNGERFFTGRVYAESTSSDGTVSYTCYDSLYFWKGSNLLSYQNKNVSHIFKSTGSMVEVTTIVVDECTYVPPRIMTENSTYFSVVQDAFDRALLAGYGMWVMRDDGSGNVQLINVVLEYNRTKRVLIIGDTSLATSYNITRSAEDVVTEVKLIHENNEDKVRHVVTAVDNRAKKMYGRITTVETSSEEMNLSQIKDKAKNILNSKNVVKNTFDVNLVGHSSLLPLRAGDGILVNFNKLGKFGLNGRPFLIDSITHNITARDYTVDLNLLGDIFETTIR